MLSFEAGAFYVMDRGYADFARLYALHQTGAFFVTWAKSPMDARRVYSAATDRSTGVISDQQVMLNGYYWWRRRRCRRLVGRWPGVPVRPTFFQKLFHCPVRFWRKPLGLYYGVRQTVPWLANPPRALGTAVPTGPTRPRDRQSSVSRS